MCSGVPHSVKCKKFFVADFWVLNMELERIMTFLDKSR